MKKYLLLLLIPVIALAQWGSNGISQWGAEGWDSQWVPLLSGSGSRPSPLLLLEAQYGGTITSDANGVSPWYDRTTNDNDYTQATADKKPDYVNGNQVKFDGTDDFLTTSFVIVGQSPYTYYFQVGSTDLTIVNTVASCGAWGQGQEGIEFWINTDGTITIRVEQNNVGSAPFIFTSASAHFTGSNVMNFGFRWSGIATETGQLLVGGVAVEDVTPTKDWTGNSVQGLELGSDSGGTIRFLVGSIFKVYVDNEVISDINLRQLDNYFGRQL